MPISAISCVDKYHNSPCSFATTPGKILKVMLVVAAVAGACLSHFFGKPLPMTIAIGLVPVPFLITDFVISCCHRRKAAVFSQTSELDISKPQLNLPNKLFEAIEKQSLTKVQSVLDSRKFDANQMHFGESALTYSLKFDNVGITYALLARGIFDLTMKNKSGATFLEQCLISKYPNNNAIKDVIFLFLQRQTDLKQVISKDFIFLHLLNFIYLERKETANAEISFLIQQFEFTTSVLMTIAIKNHSQTQGFLFFLFQILKSKQDFPNVACELLREKQKSLYTQFVWAPILENLNVDAVDNTILLPIFENFFRNHEFWDKFVNKFKSKSKLEEINKTLLNKGLDKDVNFTRMFEYINSRMAKLG